MQITRASDLLLLPARLLRVDFNLHFVFPRQHETPEVRRLSPIVDHRRQRRRPVNTGARELFFFFFFFLQAI